MRRRDEIVILPVSHSASIVAEGELLHITTIKGDRTIVTYRLAGPRNETRPRPFIRLGRGTPASHDAIESECDAGRNARRPAQKRPETSGQSLHCGFFASGFWTLRRFWLDQREVTTNNPTMGPPTIDAIFRWYL